MRRAFTLVELLVTISIIAVLSALALGALYSAQDQAKAMKTRGTIAKLHNAMMARYESYKTRRVPVVIPAGTNSQAAAKLRLDALRELMRLEMPERYSDITDDPATSLAVPALTRMYRRKLSAGRTDQYQGAECLYLILSAQHDGDESLLEAFSESEISDLDNDGMKEFRDAWNRPVRYLRWAPAFRSELQTSDPDQQPDPFDHRKVYAGTFALFPLIYSAGPDGMFDIVSDTSPSEVRYSLISNNPFDASVLDQVGKADDIPQDGQPADGELGWADNIHNHLIGTR